MTKLGLQASAACPSLISGFVYLAECRAVGITKVSLVCFCLMSLICCSLICPIPTSIVIYLMFVIIVNVVF